MNHTKDIILCDIDGTISLRGDRDPHDLSLVIEDAPRPQMVALLHHLELKYDIVYISGRRESSRPSTVYWLNVHGFPSGLALLMRGDRDDRNDAVVKFGMYEGQILPYYNVAFVLDDRNKVVDMWRKEAGLLCFQVDFGDF